MPSNAYSCWAGESPPQGSEWKPATSCQLLPELMSLARRYPSQEVSGALGINWVSWSPGGRDSALADSTRIVTWHSHPPGLPFFSVEDWLTFSTSKACASVLLWGSNAAVYARTGKSPATVFEPAQLRAYPALSLQAFSRQIGMTGDIRPSGERAARRDARAANRLGVKRHVLTG